MRTARKIIIQTDQRYHEFSRMSVRVNGQIESLRTLLPFKILGYARSMSKGDTPDQPSAFATAWKQCFGETPPLGHVLRHDFPAYWTRCHALPEAKRYAGSDDERDVIIFRANRLAEACFGETAPVWITTGHPAGLARKDNALPVRMTMSQAMTWIDQTEAPEDQSKITFFAALFEWKPNSLDKLFSEIAEDKVRAILFSADTQTVLSPYDGGFDIVSLQPGRIDELESKYRAWMSRRSDKL